VALAVVVLVAVAGLVLATFFAASFVVPVVVAAPLGGADARESGARHRRDDQGDGEQQKGFGESSSDHGRHSVFHNGANPATPTAPVAWASATSERTSSYCARVRLRRAWLSADCDSSRSVVVAVPALSDASVTR
jgi:hypothetical protein